MAFLPSDPARTISSWGTVLVCSWGRLGTTGQERRERFVDPVAAQKELMRWMRVKQRRGYREDMDG
ncbi:WGR domain-containing protein [Gluconobacter kondonii]|uniref:WGR domain-containing protein n=1 Tax=Gluconobacter kondonii TaxID=941463 RepID=UPI001B8C2A03|nr:WGR domain-containing protein [Gluconobacter kondonii]